MKRHIPNFVTILNLLTGVVGIWFVLEHNPFYGALLIFLASVFDFADGFLARQLKAYSTLGKSLDSLADMVSFGVLPGFLVFRLQTMSIGLGLGYEWIPDLKITEIVFLITPLLIPAFSAIRLAKFDNDTRQTEEFRGLPTPANAIFVAAWVFSYSSLHSSLPWLYLPWVVFGISTILAVLLVTDIPMFSLKFKTFDFTENSLRYIFLGISLLAIGFLRIPGIMLVIGIYIALSIARNFLGKSKPIN
jgi:CDP-diacylglycerol---serine O-phosphatidyltransferase